MQNRYDLKCICFAICLLAPVFAFAQYEKPISTDPNVRIGRLPNGFTYYIRKNALPANRAIFYLATKAGSVLEGDDQQGLAHFVEHMGFAGTTHYPKNELVNYLQKVGVRFGADLNAYTSFDETVYKLPIPTDDPSIVNNGIQIIRDWAQEATFDPADIDKERGVILEEKRFRSGSNERVSQKTYPVIYNNSVYNKRMPIGKEEVITSFKPETIKRFYHDWYRPDLEAIIAVGDFDVAEIENTIKAKFADMKNPDNERERPVYHIGLQDQHQYAAVTDKERLTTYAEILLKHGSSPVVTEADYCDNMIMSLFNIMVQNRYRDLKNKGYTQIANIGSFVRKYPGGMLIYNANVTTTVPDLEYSLKATWRETIRAAKFGFTSDEFKKASSMFYGSKLSAYQNREKTASQTYVDQYLGNFLRAEPIPGEQEDLKLAQFFFTRITLTNVNQFGTQFISDPNRDVIIIAPDKDKEKLPDESTVTGWLNDVFNETMGSTPEKSAVKTGPLIAKKPSKSKILSQKSIESVGVTEMVLSNGVKVVLKPTDFGTKDIRFNSFGIGGSETYSLADRMAITTASSVIKAGGVGDLNATQLKQYINNRAVNVTPFINSYEQGISGFCAPDNQELAMQLINQYITSPKKDSSAYVAFQDKLKPLMGTRRNAIIDSITGYKDLTIDRVYGLYKERFANAAGFTFVFVGNFDVKEITPLLERYLGSLPANASASEPKPRVPPLTHRSRTTYSGLEPKATVTMQYTGDYTYNTENNAQFQALAEVLKIRLIERLRLQESGIYSTNVLCNLSTVPASRFSLSISFVCAPDNADKLVNAALDEINKLKNDGPDVVNIDKYKAANDRQMETQVKNNAFWLGYLYRQYFNNGDVEDVINYQTVQNKITQQSLKAIATSYLTDSNFERRTVLPESMKK